MSDISLCSIVISAQIPLAEIEALETSLQINSIKVQKAPSRLMGADDIVFICTVMGGIAAAVNLGETAIKGVKAIIKWRQKVKEKGIEPEGKLEHPERPDLDLKAASDEEIEEWFKL